MRYCIPLLLVLALVLSACQGPPAEIVSTPQYAHGIVTQCSHGGEPIAVSDRTPACRYRGRIYYFGGQAGCSAFMQDPEAGVRKMPANTIPQDASPCEDDVGVRTGCAKGGEVFTIAEDTPAAYYNRRIYYFRGPKGCAAFKADPQYWVAKNPANKLPRVIQPPPADLGKKVRCARGGEELTVTKETPALLHKGKVYYFGGPKGRKAFRANPQGFILREHKK